MELHHPNRYRPIRSALLAVLLVSAFSGPAAAAFESLLAPKARLWQRWTAHDPRSTARLDHGAWDIILKRYLVAGEDGLNRFAYGRVSPRDRKALKSYIERLAAVRVSQYARGEQKAYWINLYNALTVQVVLARYPVGSIRDIDISPGLFADGPWDKKLITIENTPVSLNDIEHRILRPIWRDPRIHYALNCASIGCPNLRRTAYTGKNTPQLLSAGARDYVNSPRGVIIDGTKLVVSSIYVWFKSDFGGNDARVIAHLRRYAAAKLKAKLKGFTKIDRHAYDWRLNGQK
ncbi:MAG: DUF547 domain-containing protein [Alphaproteobacteria bacterium]|nr:DUF547 domain-containing protein [Alphaproteobacteria bacterium]